MKKIKNINIITDIYKDWRPSDVVFIKYLEWSAYNFTMILSCQQRKNMIKWPDFSEDFFEVSVVFKGISNLKLNFEGMIPHQILGFDILDISDNAFENINFQIEDYENGTISFVCEEIEITGIK